MASGEEKFYLTKQGLQRFSRELEQLKKIRALKVKGQVPDILHSEEINPEYLSFQEDLEFLESRLADLEKILKNAQVIKTPSKNEHHKVHLGATVVVEVDGRSDEFILVGSLEANPSVGKISNQSPVGKALMGRSIEEEIVISSPIKVSYKIKSIRYQL